MGQALDFGVHFTAVVRFFLLAALIQLVWSLTPSASAVIIQYLPVESYVAIRFTISGLLFLFWSLKQNGGFSLRFSDLKPLIILGVGTYGIAPLAGLYGLKAGWVVTFALAHSLNAVIVALVSIRFLGEKPGRRFPFAMLCSVLGGFALLSGKYALTGVRIAALSLFLVWGACFLEALGFVYSKRYRDRIKLADYLAVLQLSGAAFMWGVSLATGQLPVGVDALPLLVWICLTFVSVIACGVCFFLLYWLLNHIDGHKLAFFDCFHSMASAAFGLFFFSEPFNLGMCVGGVLLIFAVFLMTAGEREGLGPPASLDGHEPIQKHAISSP